MSSILILLPVEGRRLQYVLTCQSLEERWLYLLRWLTEKNIGMCTQDEYSNPDLLKPQSMYCVISKGELEDSYLLFQTLQLQDWEGSPPTPQYTTIVGNLAWLLIGKGDSLSDKVRDGKDAQSADEKCEEKKGILLGEETKFPLI